MTKPTLNKNIYIYYSKICLSSKPYEQQTKTMINIIFIIHILEIIIIVELHFKNKRKSIKKYWSKCIYSSLIT